VRPSDRKEGAMSQTTLAQPALQLSPGDHVCVFCRGPDERDQLLLPFLADGLAAGHKCLTIVDTTPPQAIVDALGPTATHDRPGDQLMVLASSEVYLGERGFDLDNMLNFYAAELRSVAADTSAYGCVRTAGEMTWALRDIPGVEDLLVYEARVNQVLAGQPEAAISLCLYDVDRFDGQTIVGVMRTHPKLVMAGTIVDNPFLVDPQTFLDQHT
jgi:hypothetical protein